MTFSRGQLVELVLVLVAIALVYFAIATGLILSSASHRTGGRGPNTNPSGVTR